MPEFRTIIDAGRPILDVSAKDPFVLAGTCRFGRAPRIFRKIDVFDTQEPEVCIIVKCFSADDLFPGKESILQSTVNTDIQRPSVLKKVFFYIGDKGTFFQGDHNGGNRMHDSFRKQPARRMPYNGIHCPGIKRRCPV